MSDEEKVVAVTLNSVAIIIENTEPEEAVETQEEN